MTTEGRQPLSIPLFARAFKEEHAAESGGCLDRLRQVAKEGGNMFACIMEIVDHVTLGQITEVLFETQGRFRRDL
jgi:methylmalonyl-CoA mutase